MSFIFVSLFSLALAAPAFAGVRCNSLPGPGDFTLRAYTTASGALNTDFVTKRTGKVDRTTQRLAKNSVSASAILLRTVPTRDNAYGFQTYTEVQAKASGHGKYNGAVYWYDWESSNGVHYGWTLTSATSVECSVTR